LDDPHAEGQFVTITVSDTGSGMSDEVRERAFEPFFTTKASGRGTGLGLSTVYGFAKQSHGAVTLGSAPGAGTTVTLYIPQPNTAPQSGAQAHSANQTLPLHLRVLLVEDDSEVRKVAQSFLVALGCDTTTAATAEQALLTLGSVAPFDLLLSDIALGAGMRGTALASEVQQRFPSVAILLTSGFSAELLEADRSSPSTWELLRKPYSRAALAEAIAKVLARRATG
jgi:CheY-like chemotaxis protein